VFAYDSARVQVSRTSLLAATPWTFVVVPRPLSSASFHPSRFYVVTNLSARHVIKFLEANKRSITTSAEIAQVATISANGDKHVGQLIATAMEKVRRNINTCSFAGTSAD
jgi:chaperonin GroEL (HSP60 family)